MISNLRLLMQAFRGALGAALSLAALAALIAAVAAMRRDASAWIMVPMLTSGIFLATGIGLASVRARKERWRSEGAWGRRFDELDAQVGDLRVAVQSAQEWTGYLNAVRAELHAVQRDLERHVPRRTELDALHEQLDECVQGLQDLHTQFALAAPANSSGNKDTYGDPRTPLAFQPFDRTPSSADLKRIAAQWGPQLGIRIPEGLLSYFAAKIEAVERNAAGRLACTTQGMIIRTLVAMAAARKRREREEATPPALDVLEIGTLFGVSLGALNECLVGHANIRATAVDPLDGYYAADQLDLHTGVPVNAEVFQANMSRMNIRQDAYTLVQKRSPAARSDKIFDDRLFDVIVIDGDHSEEGVTADWQAFRDRLRPGGYVIFDDYGKPSWPEVAPAVDRLMEADRESMQRVGVAWHTAVYRAIQPTI